MTTHGMLIPMVDTLLELPARTLTDGTSTPKHQQLREILEELCRTQLKPGDMLPGERALEEQYGVSRITVRRAIGDLVATGQLRRSRGKGTFVAQAPMITRLQLASFSDEMAARKIEASSKILASSWSSPSAVVHEFFGTEQGTPHTHLVRVRLGGGKPFCINDAWYNSAIAPDLLENDVYKSVYSILEQNYGASITGAEQITTAVAATPETARILGVDVGEPLLKVERHAHAGENPIEWCSSLYRTDRFALRTFITK
ncbi:MULTISPECIES: GntR family transcriptional regulator [Corynebacterium]|uniref:GntR family transcriptional regulator n=1 Tax=Corynebacterium belfantii TaxID=2014537 RepID=A0ABS0LBL5_9CORY|nr:MULTISPECIES: GntR family transcriptional regulator [Corynebacterium]OLN15963.1 GntR family transcriptional regulator [Corynebacterium diphtheriae subsp. lausannense]MBG9243449.1 GntR family transcriptional regulator [Corynebacterium belfantii]MBG9258832.1 GntR family transcriptional regulator [Corynebacterium belfantii]MBG9265519.1 GntR family transcriptional regulator [Corynebacterium belfantii]MBG9287011.1 GntR family transcriptional regulator [Corynebacterium belfantii]